MGMEELLKSRDERTHHRGTVQSRLKEGNATCVILPTVNPSHSLSMQPLVCLTAELKRVPVLLPRPHSKRRSFPVVIAPNPEECGPSLCDCKCFFKLVHFHSAGSAVLGGSGTCRLQLMAEPPTWSQASLVVKRGITDGGTSGYLLSFTPRQ